MPTLINFPVSLPLTPISQDVDAEKIAFTILPHFAAFSQSSFVTSAVWRDLYALTGTLRTLHSSSSILSAWTSSSGLLKPTDFSLQPDSAQVFRAGPACWIQASFDFETEQTNCQAIVSLVQDIDGGWKIWMLRTILIGLKGSGESSVDFLVVEKASGESKEKQQQKHFDCVIVGGGQAGLSMAGRLKALGLSYVVLEKYSEVGDNWKMRYDSCKRKFMIPPSCKLK
jgi:hypothetical protein